MAQNHNCPGGARGHVVARIHNALHHTLISLARAHYITSRSQPTSLPFPFYSLALILYLNCTTTHLELAYSRDCVRSHTPSLSLFLLI